MTRTRKHDVTGTKLGDEMISVHSTNYADLSYKVIHHPEFGELTQLEVKQQTENVRLYVNELTSKYYACWYKPELAGFNNITEVPSVWAQNVISGNVSFIAPFSSGNDTSGESYNLGEFEALHRRMEWETQKTTYWRKEAESRQSNIEYLNVKVKRQKKDLIILLWCMILVLVSASLIVTMK